MGIREILEGVDVHEVNRIRFHLPTRLVAKTFLFRLIYGGTEWSYAQDPEFTSTSTKPKFWRGVIDEFYAKYTDLAKWHAAIVERAISDGGLTIPSGRQYKFVPYRDKKGELRWPRTTILNYPVQGLSADLMSIARVSTFKRIKKLDKRVLLANTVHDDLELDCPEEPELIWETGKLLESVFEDIPMNFERLFKIPFNVPLVGEISVGKNLKEMIDLQEWIDKGRKV